MLHGSSLYTCPPMSCTAKTPETTNSSIPIRNLAVSYAITLSGRAAIPGEEGQQQEGEEEKEQELTTLISAPWADTAPVRRSFKTSKQIITERITGDFNNPGSYIYE